MSTRPDKPVTQFTDEELVTAIEEQGDEQNAVTRQIVLGCWREWERRKGLRAPEPGGQLL